VQYFNDEDDWITVWNTNETVSCTNHRVVIVQVAKDSKWQDDWITVWTGIQIMQHYQFSLYTQVTNDSEWQEAIRVRSYQN